MLENNHNEIIEFQKELDSQFLKIYEQRNKGIKNTEDIVHGLLERVCDFKFFIPLSSLRSIGSDNKYESLPLMAKWVIGYNQMLGDLYTIIDMENVINYFTANKISNNNKIIENDEYILYLRDQSVTSIALVSKSLKMQNAYEFKEHLGINNINAEVKSLISKSKSYNWDLFKKENMSEPEWNLLEAIKSLETINIKSKEDLEGFLIQETTENNKYQKMALALVEKVYLDEIGARPVFSISIPKLVQYLLKLNAY